ncbi:MAG: redox-sensing transcriptional repressor Rex [Chloroflexota bacterium]|nr:redox-sensing transcriptional repressor Rex [Chloroflexota bacterium]
MSQGSVPEIVVGRLPLYLRMLEFMSKEDKRITSSQELGERLGLSSAQIRKDLSFFGEFGKQGTGYHIEYLQKQLRQILHVDRAWQVALIGAGDLGRALVHYQGFAAQRFHLVAIFDNAPKKIGAHVGDLVVQDVADLPRVLREKKIRIVILAVPADAATGVAAKLVELGVCAILNYAPITLNVPSNVRVYHIDPVVGLQNMAYYL